MATVMTNDHDIHTPILLLKNHMVGKTTKIGPPHDPAKGREVTWVSDDPIQNFQQLLEEAVCQSDPCLFLIVGKDFSDIPYCKPMVNQPHFAPRTCFMNSS